MIKNIQRKWFEVWGESEAQNSILKYFVLVLTTICTAELILICILALKNPLIISVTEESTTPIERHLPNANSLMKEIVRAIKGYLKTRNNWDWTNVESRVKEGANYIAPDFRDKYLIKSQEQIRIAKEKQVEQKLFSEDPIVDMKLSKATVKTERVLIANGLRAAQEMVFEIGYAVGSRTQTNPEGIYITSEEVKNQNKNE